MCVDPDGPAPDQVAYDQAVFYCKFLSPEQISCGVIDLAELDHDQILNKIVTYARDYPTATLHFIIRVLGRLGFIQHNPREIKTWPIYPTSHMSSWGSIDLAQLEACIKEELSK